MNNKCLIDEIRNRKKKISLANLKDISSRISRLNNRTKSFEDLLSTNKSIISDYFQLNQSNLSINENLQEHFLENNENSSINLPYYYENLDREQSESILRLINHPGCFLIRKHQNNSSTLISSPYVLSLISPSFKIVHYLLYKINEKLFLKPFSQQFYYSIKHLVDQHRLNQGVLPCKLIEYPISTHSNRNTISSSSSSSSPLLSLSSSSSTTTTTSSSLIIQTNQLIRQQIIGRGHFGIVYKGLYNEKIDVAIKTFSTSCIYSSDECETNMLNEARTMMHLTHPYLIHLYGISRCDNQLCLVTEYISNGCLLFWLQKQQKQDLSLTNSLSHRLQLFSFQICDAMDYLESKSIIHRDLAARNCLIDDQANFVKVGDFGMARFMSSSSSMIYEGRSDTPFPLRWSSPEVLLYREYSSKSDVWSYGILLWEIFSLGQIPFGDLISNDIAAQLIKIGHMPSKPPLANQILFEQIISPCWTLKTIDRPAFSSLKETFTKIFQLPTTSSLH